MENHILIERFCSLKNGVCECLSWVCVEVRLRTKKIVC